MSDTRHFMKKNPENNEKAAKEPLTSKKRGDAEQSLSRMTSQAIKRFPHPFGWLNYLLHLLFFDPHPPFILRQWLLRKHARLLRNGFTKPAVINED